MLTIAVLVAFAVAVAAAIASNREPDTPTGLQRALDDARAEAAGSLSGRVSGIAQPISQTRAVRQAAASNIWKNQKQQVAGSGMFGGSFEVYLSYQLAHLVIATMLLLFALTATLDGLTSIAFITAAALIAFYPTLKMRERLNKRRDQVGAALPEFVELLSMCLTAMTVKQALAFTVRFTDNIVSDATRWLLDTLESRTMSEQDAFREAGVRVGTPEAVAFFTALGRGHTEGAKVREIINKQAETLRIQSFNKRRGDMKKLPTKMILIFGLHFLPLLFIVAMVPLLLGFDSF